ncbi:MAG: cysteine-rich CWC family protein [Parvularculales bacterium]
MQKLICEECGTEFNCGTSAEGTCWCHNLPNMRESFDLAGKCVCPDCLTQGKAKAITRMRRQKKAVRSQNAIR